MLRVEPERDFLVTRYSLLFEQKLIVDIDIDYAEDARGGWIPNGWRVSQMLGVSSKFYATKADRAAFIIKQ